MNTVAYSTALFPHEHQVWKIKKEEKKIEMNEKKTHETCGKLIYKFC